MTLTYRPIGEDEQRTARKLGQLAFGGPRLAPEDPLPPRPYRQLWGAFESGQLLAMVGDIRQEQWFGGRLVPAAGISSVAVAPGHRSKGHAQALLAVVLRAARERGAAVSTLFPTAPALYRRLGWETTGAMTWWDLATSSLAGLRAPGGTTTRTGTPDDQAGFLEVYRELASRSNGYLERSPARFPDWPFHADHGIDGVTVATGPEGTIDGFSTWVRGEGIGGDARLCVDDLHARTLDAATALLADIGSWGAVTPTVTLLLPRPDPAWWVMPVGVPRPRQSHLWMTRLVDVPAAIAARGWPANVDVSLDLEITDADCPWNAGRFILRVSGGAGSMTAGGTGALAIGARGLGVLYAGGVPAAMLRAGGLISGGDAATDLALDAVMAGPPPSTVNGF